MSHYRNSPIRVFIDGEPVQLKPAGGNRFRSKKFEYQIEYDSSGKLIGKVVRPLNQASADGSSERTA
ncbi:hypothetical protein [Spirosoma pomorum]